MKRPLVHFSVDTCLVNPAMVLACIRHLVPDGAPTRDVELRELLPVIDRILLEVKRANERRYELEAAA